MNDTPDAEKEVAAMKLRAFISALVALAIIGFVLWLQFLGFVESTATIVAGAAAYGVLTWGRGVPLHLPPFLQPVAEGYRKDFGEEAWKRITGLLNGLSPLLQAVAYGAFVFATQSFMNGLLSTRFEPEVAEAVATIAAGAVAAFALRVFVYRFVSERGNRHTFGHSTAAWASLFPTRFEVNPYVGMAFSSILSAILVWLIKSGLVRFSEALTDWRLLVAIGAVVLLVAVVPGPVQRGLARLFYRPKEATDVRAN